VQIHMCNVHTCMHLPRGKHCECVHRIRHAGMRQMLVYDQDVRCSPVAHLWSVDKRRDLAGRLSRTLRQAQGALPPPLTEEHRA